MTITEDTWVKYIEDLRKVNTTAAEKFKKYIETHVIETYEQWQAAIDYGYGLATLYGEAAAELACEMYDAMAELSGVMFPAAEPAATATYAEVAKTLNGIKKYSQDIELLSSGISRLVKMAGVDTTMENAIRDGAEWAWIPHGDTCAYCIALASNGWQKASRDAMKGGHAEHIHGNCDCTYAIRFNENTKYKGYDYERYKKMYKDADKNGSSKDKINAMRRRFYAENSEKINEQKKSAYAKRKERESSSAEELNI